MADVNSVTANALLPSHQEARRRRRKTLVSAVQNGKLQFVVRDSSGNFGRNTAIERTANTVCWELFLDRNSIQKVAQMPRGTLEVI